MKKKEFYTTAYVNTQKYNYYYSRLITIAQTLFSWKNLPKGMNRWYLEKTLLRRGSIAFFRDDIMGWLNLPYVDSGGYLDVYGYPTIINAYGQNGYQSGNLDARSNAFALCFDNTGHYPIIPFLQLFAVVLSDIDCSIMVNVHAQKTPIVIICDEKQRLVFENLMERYDGNTPVIYGNKDLDLSAVKYLSTEAPYNSDKMQELKTDIWNEALSFIGVNNLSVRKKERIITDEAKQMLGGTVVSRLSRLIPRLEAAEALNELIQPEPGKEITVTTSEDLIGEMIGGVED